MIGQQVVHARFGRGVITEGPDGDDEWNVKFDDGPEGWCPLSALETAADDDAPEPSASDPEPDYGRIAFDAKYAAQGWTTPTWEQLPPENADAYGASAAAVIAAYRAAHPEPAMSRGEAWLDGYEVGEAEGYGRGQTDARAAHPEPQPAGGYETVPARDLRVGDDLANLGPITYLNPQPHTGMAALRWDAGNGREHGDAFELDQPVVRFTAAAPVPLLPTQEAIAEMVEARMAEVLPPLLLVVEAAKVVRRCRQERDRLLGFAVDEDGRERFGAAADDLDAAEEALDAAVLDLLGRTQPEPAERDESERWCRRCGGRNLRSCSVDSNIWNATIRGIGGEGDPTPTYENTGEIICPACFTEACEAVGLDGNWELVFRGTQTPEFLRRMADHLEARNDRAAAFAAPAARVQEPTPERRTACQLGLVGTCRGDEGVEVWDDRLVCARCMHGLRAMADENDAETDPEPERPDWVKLTRDTLGLSTGDIVEVRSWHPGGWPWVDTPDSKRGDGRSVLYPGEWVPAVPPVSAPEPTPERPEGHGWYSDAEYLDDVLAPVPVPPVAAPEPEPAPTCRAAHDDDALADLRCNLTRGHEGDHSDGACSWAAAPGLTPDRPAERWCVECLGQQQPCRACRAAAAPAPSPDPEADDGTVNVKLSASDAENIARAYAKSVSLLGRLGAACRAALAALEETDR